MDRREFLKLTIAGASVVGAAQIGGLAAFAQEATPEGAAPLYAAGELGLPELIIDQTDEGFEAPAEVPAGRHLLTVRNSSSMPSGGAGFIALAEDETLDDMVSRFEAINDFFEAMESGGPPEGDDPTAFLFERLLIGGPVVEGPGSVGQAIVDLPAGHYAIWTEDFSGPLGEITVAGEMPADLSQPDAVAKVVAVDVDDRFDFELEGEITTGRTLLEYTNDSSQPHFLWLMSSPVELSDEQWGKLLMLQFGGGTPAANSGLPDLEEIGEVGGTTSQSQGQTMWWAIDLPVGHYGIFCFIPDPRHQGVPHSMMGMIASFTVA
jgi:hypothetical protein